MRYILNLFIITLTISFGFFIFSSHAGVPTPGCNIVIQNQTIPESDVDFPFTISGEINEEFVLQDTDEEFFFIPNNSTVTVTEQAPAGWVLRDLACDIGEGFDLSIEKVSNGVQLTCTEEIEITSVECTFINAQSEAIPTFSQWGIVALVVVLGIVGFTVLRRRKVTA